MYHIEEKNGLYRIDVEEHGEIYPGWREFSALPEKLQTRLALRAAASLGNLSKLNGISEQISSNEWLIYWA